jgi:hypothetical protein
MAQGKAPENFPVMPDIVAVAETQLICAADAKLVRNRTLARIVPESRAP